MKASEHHISEMQNESPSNETFIFGASVPPEDRLDRLQGPFRTAVPGRLSPKRSAAHDPCTHSGFPPDTPFSKVGSNFSGDVAIVGLRSSII